MRRHLQLLALKIKTAPRPSARAVFALCLVMVFFALGWTSASLLQIETARRAELRECALGRSLDVATRNTTVRLAEWVAIETRRMDALFETPPETPFAQPLPTLPPPYVRLHFQISSDLVAATPAILAGTAAAVAAEGVLAELRARFPNAGEFHAAFFHAVSAHMRGLGKIPGGALGGAATGGGRAGSSERRRFGGVSALLPVWIGNDLFLLRAADTPQGDCIQGVWVDWPALREALLEGVTGELPAADIRKSSSAGAGGGTAGGAAGAGAADSAARSLFPMPLTLCAGARPPDTTPLVTSARLVLVVCWFFAILALTGGASVFFAILALSERRAAFVSAVTHELRTPLTTFQLYTEMLAEGMVPPEGAKKYIATLRDEATRLTHLVENVLGFARLERGKKMRRDDVLALSEIAERVAPRLRARLEGAGMTFAESTAAGAGDARLRTDITAVEQILFNLADNAAKYAGEGRRAELEINVRDGLAVFDFRDDGPGIPRASRRKIFNPFHRSAEAAAGRKPGVGLGLAISRQLARQLGGELVHLADVSGCAFRLTLPVGKGAGKKRG
ncbi:MAG: HAMP domain-containing histidine kinase [Puniceicoccales bacterium]|jgi:signal transduction histidine kinase|nr:HAMP domain-containing histidine kinase [Puniceicoccales bacterium]